MSDWERRLVTWTGAGVIDRETAARIRAYELTRAGSERLRWPIWVALAFGALMVGAGVLLFVSAHWDALSPQSRFALVLLPIVAFHVAGAAMVERFPPMAAALHAVGTVALGSGIFLAGQIFNLDEHWPGGVMLWTIGAAFAWLLLRETPQMAFVALLAPAWLAGEWLVAAGDHLIESYRVLACGVFLLALAYFTAARGDRPHPHARILVWIGGLSLPPAALFLADPYGFGYAASQSLSIWLRFVGWTGALGVPLAVAFVLRRVDAWPQAVAAIWVLVWVNLDAPSSDITEYLWWALGAIGLVAWGVREARSQRINMGAAIFAVTVAVFYFSEVMDKLGRSASLVGLGILFLGGGWALERIRRRLILQARGDRA